MSGVTIIRHWGDDGDALQVTIDIDDEYPDALDQARATAVRAYHEALDVTLAYETDDTDDD